MLSWIQTCKRQGNKKRQIYCGIFSYSTCLVVFFEGGEATAVTVYFSLLINFKRKIWKPKQIEPHI